MRVFKLLRSQQSLLTLQIGLNSVVGYLFLKTLAVQFGTSAQKDGFDIAYSVPFIIMSVSGFTFLHSVTTTQFSRMLVNASHEAKDALVMNEVFSTLLNTMLLLGGALMLLCALFAGPLSDLLAPGLAMPVRHEMQGLIVWICPLVLTLGISTYLSAVLVAHSVPVAMEFCQLISRVGLIAGAWGLGCRYTFPQIAAGLVVCSGAGLTMEWALLRRITGLRYRPILHWHLPKFQSIARQAAGFLCAALGAQISMSVMRRQGTLAGVGTTASMTYALSVAGPLTLLIGKPLALTKGLDYIRLCERQQWQEARRVFQKSLGLCLLLTLGVVLAGNHYAPTIIRLLYRGGKFNGVSVTTTTQLFRILNWSLPGAVISSMTLVPLLNATRTHSAATLHTLSYAAHLGIGSLLFSLYGRYGLAWGYLVPSLFQAVVGTGLVYRELKKGRHMETRSRQSMRVLFVIPGEEQGPSMIFAKRQAAFLVEAGIAGRTFYLASRTNPVLLLREWLRLRRMVREFQPDLIHAHFGTMTGFFCAYGVRVPLVITYRGSDLNPAPSDPPLRLGCGHLLSHLAARRAAGIICVSAQLRARLVWDRNRAFVIPSGVDTTRFFPRSRNDARAKLGWPQDARIVLFNAGRNPRVKRLDLATAAVEAARTRIGPIRFEVLDGYVEADRIPLMMNAADCLVFTSDWEGAPTVIQEALACNLPIVSVRVGDVPERLEGVTPSRLVARDACALGEALAEILTLGERSNGWEAAQQIALPVLIERVMDVYRTCLDRG